MNFFYNHTDIAITIYTTTIKKVLMMKYYSYYFILYKMFCFFINNKMGSLYIDLKIPTNLHDN